MGTSGQRYILWGSGKDVRFGGVGILRVALDLEVSKKRKPGRPKKTWKKWRRRQKR